MANCNSCSEIIESETSSGCTECSNGCTQMFSDTCIVVTDAYTNIGTTENQGLPDVLTAIDEFFAEELVTDIITIPNANCLTLFNSPYTIIASPASDEFLDIISISVRIYNGTTNFALAAGNLKFGFDTNANPSWDLDTSIVTQHDSSLLIQATKSTPTAPNITLGKKFVLYSTTNNLTTGDGQIQVFISYRIASTT